MKNGPLYIPNGARKVTDKATGATAYLYERNGKLCAILCAPKATAKHCGHYAFPTEERRAKWVEQAFQGFRNHQTRINEAKAEKKAFKHTLQVGHVLTASWGYEQTNIDFYLVTKVTGKQVEICKIPSIEVSTNEPYMQGKAIPDIDGKRGETMRRMVTRNNSVRIASYAYARLWDGRPEHYTSYA